jgi:TRAP-type C4-dicarboxylate transport system permease small subunit
MLKVQRLLRQRWQVLLAMLALVLGLALVGFFGVRAWHQYEYAHRVASGAVRVESLRGWMTLPYIEKAYGVPEQELRTALGLPSEGF